MAAIDKLRGNGYQQRELYSYLEVNKPSGLKEMYELDIWTDRTDNDERPIANFSESLDMWLLKKCPFTWVTDQIKEQYGYEKKKDKKNKYIKRYKAK